jgi:hypothetical protein
MSCRVENINEQTCRLGHERLIVSRDFWTATVGCGPYKTSILLEVYLDFMT